MQETESQPQMAEYLNYYEKNGFAVLPFIFKSKQPSVSWKEFQETPPNRQQLAKWFSTAIANHVDVNIGLILGKASDGLICLDFESPEYYHRVFSKHEDLEKETVVVRTGRGFHVYFRCYDAVNRKIYDEKGVLAVEVRSTGSLIVAPPSIHPNGRTYAFVNEKWRELAPKTVSLKEIETALSVFPTKSNFKHIPSETVAPTTKLLSLPCLKRVQTPETPHPQGKRDELAFILAEACKHDGLARRDATTILTQFFQNCERTPDFTLNRCLSKIDEKRTDFFPHGRLKELGLCDGKCGFLSVDAIIAENEPPPVSFKYLTNHLPNFDDFARSLNLIGSDYLPLKKLHYFGAISAAAATLSIKLGRWKTDTRLSTVNPIPAGHGKQNLLSFYEKTCGELERIKGDDENEDYSFGNPSSYHPEALVGKKIPISEGKGAKKHIHHFEENRGYLDKHVVCFDECKQLLEPEKGSPQEQSRVYIRRALNPYGENWLEKPQVDVKMDSPLKYLSRSRIHMFTQPRHLNAELITEGYIRRAWIGAVRFLDADRPNKIALAIKDGKENPDDYFGSFFPVLRRARETSLKPLSFSPEALEVLSNYYPYLVEFGKGKGGNASEETEIEEFTLAQDHAKIALLFALANGRSRVTPEDVRMTFPDVIEFFDMKWGFVNGWIAGKISFSGETVNYREMEILEFLHEKGAVSKEISTVKVAEILEVISRVYGQGGKPTTDRTARNYLRKMKEKGLLDSGQKNQTTFLVWLSTLGQKALFHTQGGKAGMGGMGGWLPCYFEISNEISMISTPKLHDDLGSLKDTTFHPSTLSAPSALSPENNGENHA